MPKKLWLAALVVCLLAPSAWMAWRYRDMPHLGKMQDDALYLVGAKSLAEGRGYRISSLPGEPFQTKYPPLFSAYLSLFWRLNPSFPANIPGLMLAAWILLPLFLSVAWLALRTLDLPTRDSALILAFLAISPYAIFIAINLLTELFAGAILLFAIWTAMQAIRDPERHLRWVMLAGLATGAAYLSRTALVPLFIAIPVWFALQRRWRSIAIFYALSTPAAIGWTLWCGSHRLTTSDPTLLYYTNYLGLYLRDLNWEAFQMMIWKNSSLFLASTGQILLPNLLSNDLVLNFSRLLGFMCWSGLARLWRRQGYHPLFLFTVIYTGLMVAWNYPPDERLVFPVAVALLAGFAVEARFLADLLRTTWRTKQGGEKAFAGLLAAACAAVAVISVWQSIDFTFNKVTIPMEDEKSFEPERLRGYAWIRQNTPPDAKFMAWNDPVFYLFTGRPAVRITYPARLYYVGDLDQVRDYLYGAKRFAIEQKLDYVFLARNEVLPSSPEEHRADFWRISCDRAAGPAVWQSKSVRILRAADFPDVALEFQSEKKLARSNAAIPAASQSR